MTLEWIDPCTRKRALNMPLEWGILLEVGWPDLVQPF